MERDVTGQTLTGNGGTEERAVHHPQLSAEDAAGFGAMPSFIAQPLNNHHAPIPNPPQTIPVANPASYTPTSAPQAQYEPVVWQNGNGLEQHPAAVPQAMPQAAAGLSAPDHLSEMASQDYTVTPPQVVPQEEKEPQQNSEPASYQVAVESKPSASPTIDVQSSGAKYQLQHAHNPLQAVHAPLDVVQATPYQLQHPAEPQLQQPVLSSGMLDNTPHEPAEPLIQPQEAVPQQAVESLQAAPISYELELAQQPAEQAPPLQKKKVDKPKTVESERKMRLGDSLIHFGLISEDQLQVALQEQRQSKKLLGAILVDMGFVTESALGEILAESAGTDTFDPAATMLDPNLLGQIPKDVCMRHKVIPVAQDKEGSVSLAMADVYDVLALDQARRHLPKGVNIIPLYCTEAQVIDLIDQYYDYEISIDGILKEIETGIRDNTELDGRQDGYVNPTVRLVNALLIDAIKQEASDIHFEPEGTFLRLRYRIDGKLQQVRSFHRDYWAAMCVRLKIISGMNIAESRAPQDGRIAFKALGRDIDFRVATQPTVHGENIVLRILDKSKALLPIDQLGFTEHNRELLKRCLKRPEGIIIVTGPTGSGKTTTLYSMLGHINSIDVNIMTLEDPVEYQIPLIRQTNVREGSIDFSGGIKSLMRQDPDIIFIGEVRDEETALMSVRAALTGHQVFTTLHTNDALGAIPRLGDIGVPAHLLAGSLIASIAQRLARKLCPHCKREVVASEDDCRVLGIDQSEAPRIYEAEGCDQCSMKGYKGRTAIIEILRVDEGMDELISTHATRNHMMEYALENGFVPMVQDGISKVLAGEIDLKELIGTVDLTDRL